MIPSSSSYFFSRVTAALEPFPRFPHFSLERSEDKNCGKWGAYMQDKGDQLAEATAEGLAFC